MYHMKQRVSDNPVFLNMPYLGFEIGTSPYEKVHYVFWRKAAAFDDWQEARRLVTFDLPGGSTRYQDMGNGDWELKTGAWFRSAADYQRFLAISRQPGVLRMNADYTMHRDLGRDLQNQVKVIVGRRYAEFDNVRVLDVTNQSFDNDGGVRCEVVYRRPYVAPTIPTAPTWPEPPIPAFAWPYGSGDYGDGPYGYGEPDPPEEP